MRIGVLTVLLSDLPLTEALDYLASIGVQDLEIGCGGYPGNAHCNAAELLADDEKLAKFQEAITSRGLNLSALAMHGNPLHPDAEFASRHIAEERDAILLAEKLGVETVVGFSGCPGDHEGAKYPNWVTNAWPTDYPAILEWQWDTKVIPVLAGIGGVCSRPRHQQDRARDAPRLRGVQLGDDDAVARRGGPGNRRQPGPESPVLAGR